MGTLLAGAFLFKPGLVEATVPYSFLATFFFEVASSATKSSSCQSEVFFFLDLVAAFGRLLGVLLLLS